MFLVQRLELYGRSIHRKNLKEVESWWLSGVKEKISGKAERSVVVNFLYFAFPLLIFRLRPGGSGRSEVDSGL